MQSETVLKSIEMCTTKNGAKHFKKTWKVDTYNYRQAAGLWFHESIGMCTVENGSKSLKKPKELT